MLTKWYGYSSSCSDAGLCRHTGSICRPTACPLMEHTYIPDDEERNDDDEIS